MPQMPGVSPDQNIRQKEKIIDLTDGQLGVDEIGPPAATSPANGNLRRYGLRRRPHLENLIVRSLTVFLLSCVGILPGAPKRTALAVFAHPDDESVVAPLLAKYANEGHDVYLAVVTSGQIGNANTDIPKGEKLGAAREEEARCACRALGIHEPFLMQFMDGSISTRQAIPQIVERLREIFDRVKPDVVITWGPDGITGNPDHRMAHDVTTQVFQQRAKLRHPPRKLYYAAWPESLLRNLPEPLYPGAVLGLADDFVTTAVEASEYTEPAYHSMQCHKTQWTPDRVKRNRAVMEKIFEGKVFLRLALTDLPFPKKRESDILAGLN